MRPEILLYHLIRMESPELTPQQKYRLTEKCKVARQKYYETKGKETSREYYLRNKQRILERSKARYQTLKQTQEAT
jgi:hypothetical protein